MTDYDINDDDLPRSGQPWARRSGRPAMRSSHARLTRLHARAEALHLDIQHDLLGPAGDDPPLAVRQVAETAQRLAESLATCISVMVIEADPELRAQLDPVKRERKAA